ncbi:MAG: helix-turn-helix transcriptional regulator [Acidimicrobiaceae bacterium]|nr:helix-turn-helix transcriptional regulator [Acidimicrobiaceae bacterium]MYH76367.1 helix-turn-helix transcriptional regulator [Acidimicrobiaceae bacterium]
MGRRTGLESRPSLYVESGGWPHCELAVVAPPEAHLARGAALRLHEAMESNRWGLRETSRKTGLSTKVLANLLHGHTWPTLPTIARLEMRLETEIWGDEHTSTPT